jgi:signal peptide peptidase SppA
MPIVARVAARLFNTPLLLTPDTAAVIAGSLSERFDVEPLADFAGARNIGAGGFDASRFVGAPRERALDSGETATPYKLKDGVALIGLRGELVNRGAWIGASSGLTSYEGLAESLRLAAEDPAVRAILLDVDSPGGEAHGAMETAALVREIAKPVAAVVNAQAASAAYAIASGANRIFVQQSSIAGSIGVVWLHLDRSKQVAERGVKPTLLTAGAYKADGHPYAALPDDARARIQGRIDQIYGLFVDTVAAHRGMSADAVRATEAGVFIGQSAIDAGLADQMGGLDAAFAYLKSFGRNRGLSLGVNMTANNGATGADTPVITQAALDTALAQASATARSAARVDAFNEIGAAMATLFPENPRAAAFGEALQAGVPVSTAASLAGKIPLPAAAAPPAPTTKERLLEIARLDRSVGADAGAGEQQQGTPGAIPWDAAISAVCAEIGVKPRQH